MISISSLRENNAFTVLSNCNTQVRHQDMLAYCNPLNGLALSEVLPVMQKTSLQVTKSGVLLLSIFQQQPKPFNKAVKAVSQDGIQEVKDYIPYRRSRTKDASHYIYSRLFNSTLG